MTDRALWAAAQEDYTNALAIARKAWGADADQQAVQAAAATVLIHITKLRNESHMLVKIPGTIPQSAAPSPTEVKAAAQWGAVPPCPKCKGAMKDVRSEKRSEKSPDFTCLQEKGDCGKPNKDKTKWFATGAWVDKLPPRNGNPLAGQTTPQTFEQPPVALADDGPDDLPFRSER